MSYSHLLNENNYIQRKIDDQIIKYLTTYSSDLEVDQRKVKVLDWGSGRGTHVIQLLEKGFDAYGVDISKDSIELGRGLFERI